MGRGSPLLVRRVLRPKPAPLLAAVLSNVHIEILAVNAGGPTDLDIGNPPVTQQVLHRAYRNLQELGCLFGSEERRRNLQVDVCGDSDCLCLAYRCVPAD